MGIVLKNLQSKKEVNIFNQYVVAFIAFAQIFSFIAFGFNIYFQIAFFITLSQCTLLFFNIGKIIPVRYLIGTMYSINYLLVPIIMYSGLNENVLEDYRMVGLPDVYFSYAIPAMLMLILGLHLFKSKDDSTLDVKKITAIAISSPKLPIYLIVIGLICGFISPFVPSEISLIFDCIGYFKYAGFFLSLFNGKPINYFYLALTYGLLLIISLTSSLFNDLLNLLFFLGFILALRYKISNRTKILGILAVIVLVVLIQTIKFQLRERVSSDISVLTKINEAISESNEQSETKTTKDKIADVLVRLDQGWVTSRSIEYFNTGGYELQNGKHAIIILKSSILPRILAPDKLKVGDPQEFNKYSGHYVSDGTSIALGIFADGYIDFGEAGILEVFAFGLIISMFIKIYHRMDNKYPLVKIFIPIGFFYAVRPDTDTQSALGALFKITFIIWLTMIYISNNHKRFAAVAKRVK